jgi:hypothetical protein
MMIQHGHFQAIPLRSKADRETDTAAAIDSVDDNTETQLLQSETRRKLNT